MASNNSQQEKLTDQMKKFSDVVTSVSSVPSQITKSVEKTILSTVKNTEKEKNVIVFGLKESPEEDLYGLVGDLLLAINVKPKFEAERIGRGNERPIKIVLENKSRVFDVLSAAKKLKGIEEYCNVYISVDRTAEERASRKKLVAEMKEKISQDSGKHYYIRKGKVCYRDRVNDNVEESWPSGLDEKKSSSTKSDKTGTVKLDAVLLKASANEKRTDSDERTKSDSLQEEEQEVLAEIRSHFNVVCGRGRRMLDRDRDTPNRSYPRRASTINKPETPTRNRFHTLSKYS